MYFLNEKQIIKNNFRGLFSIKYISKLITYFANPLRFSFIKKAFANQPFLVLDVGSGNHSAQKMKRIFPNCKYYGLDRVKTFNNDENDYDLMEKFYEIDLTTLKFEQIPNSFFDVIILSHVLEHLYNGELVLSILIEKLKNGGYIYIEYPGVRSTRLPSMKGTLNFYDDKTHVRIYSIKEINKLFLEKDVTLLKGGYRRNLSRILFLPFIVPFRLLTINHLIASDFWDLLGFAEYVLGKKSNKLVSDN
jgi:SAM-dependent methyltransferase